MHMNNPDLDAQKQNCMLRWFVPALVHPAELHILTDKQQAKSSGMRSADDRSTACAS